jgi:hypothetical protein
MSIKIGSATSMRIQEICKKGYRDLKNQEREDAPVYMRKKKKTTLSQHKNSTSKPTGGKDYYHGSGSEGHVYKACYAQPQSCGAR